MVFEKGSFSYSPLIYEIVNKVKRKYFVRNPNSNQNLIKDYLGYKLKKVSSATAERAPGVVQRDVDRDDERARNEVRQARVGRRLQREGIQLNVARVAPRRRTRGFRPTETVGKFIKVKFDAQGVLDKNSVEMRGNRVTFYRDKVRAFDAKTKLHTVFYRSNDTKVCHNFMVEGRDDFIKRGNLKFD
jgi:hypothetical protein